MLPIKKCNEMFWQFKIPTSTFKCGKGKYKHLNAVLCMGVTILSLFTF